MFMYINSPGGSVTAGFAMFDTMRHVKSEVSTINVGLAASMGSLLLVGGAKGKRLALPHSRVMIHQPAMGGIQGQASDIKVEAEMILGIRERVVRPPPALVLCLSRLVLTPSCTIAAHLCPGQLLLDAERPDEGEGGAGPGPRHFPQRAASARVRPRRPHRRVEACLGQGRGVSSWFSYL